MNLKNYLFNNNEKEFFKTINFITSKRKKRVIVGMSGGIDSSFTAFYLQKIGFEVVGLTMLASPNKTEIGKCCSINEILDAKKVCEKLGIKHKILNLTNEFEKYVINYFIDEYLNGKTPNPCIKCNKHIKFGFLFDYAINNLDGDYFATGHYAKILNINSSFFIAKAKDLKKDQSYFLYGINKKNLKKIIFPNGFFYKKEIKDIVALNGLFNVKEKVESYDVCFVRGKDYSKFITSRIDDNKIKKGYFYSQEGNKLRRHKGIIFYTIGQRKGIGFSIGKKAYIREIRKTGDIVIGDRPIFTEIFVNKLNLFLPIEEFPSTFHVKLRYNHKGTEGYVKNYQKSKDCLNVKFIDYVDASSPGQSAVFYNGNLLIGGGILVKGTLLNSLNNKL